MTLVGNDHPIRTLAPNVARNAGAVERDGAGNAGTGSKGTGEAMTQLDRTVWTAPVRNLVWVAAHFGHR
jgi:hypothetical protein